MIEERPRRVSALPSLRAPSFTVVGTALGMAVAGGGALHPARAQVAPDEALQLPTVSAEGSQTPAPGYQTNVPGLSKLTEPLRDVPQSVTSVPRKLIDDQNDITLRDTLRNVPGISLAAGEGGSQGDNLTLRGFNTRNDIFLDGMRDFGSYTRDPFDDERVEVLKGPASILFGRGSTGGVVHQVSKQAGLAPVTAGMLTFGTDGTRRVTADVNRAITGLDGTAVRLNLMANENGTAGRDVARYRRLGVAPTATFGLGTPVRLTVSYLHQQEYDTPDYGLPWLRNRPAPVDRKTFYGFDGSDYLRTNVDVGTVRLESDLNDHVSFRNQFRYGNYRRDARITEPQVTQAVTAATPLSAIRVTRNEITVASEETFLQNQSDLTARFATGPVRHALVVGMEAGRETSSPTRRTYGNVPTTSLLFPDSSQPFTGRAAVSSRVDVSASSFGVYAIDTLKLGEHWEAIGGVRWDHFGVDYTQSVGTPVAFSRTDEMPSYRAAIIYKPVPEVSVYFGYGTSFNPSAESLSLAASSADLAPEKNRTFELGAKWDVLSERLSLTAALFRVEKQNARQTDPTDSTKQVLAGNAISDGFELGAAGHLTDRWEIFAGYSYQNARLVSAPRPQDAGHALSNAPRHTGSVFTTYELPWPAIELGGGVQYVSSRAASTAADAATGLIRALPDYWTLQAFARYHLTPTIDVQVNATNLTDKYYYDLPHPNHAIPGAGRTVLFSVSAKL